MQSALMNAQDIQLKSNGYLINLEQVDTMFYKEYPLGMISISSLKKNKASYNKMKYSLGIVNRSGELIVSDPSIYRTNFFSSKDGSLQAPTQTIFLKPVNIDSFKLAYPNLGKLDKHPTLDGYYFLYITDKKYKTGESIINLCNQIYSEKMVHVAEPVFYKILRQNNPLKAMEWHVSNSGSIPGSVIGADMGVEKAWNYSTGKGIKVAVIDDGVDLNHPDLKPNLLLGYDATGNNSKGGSDPSNAHGTNCAGIIASANNDISTIGVAYDAKIIPIRMGTVSPDGMFSTNDTWISNCFSKLLNLVLT